MGGKVGNSKKAEKSIDDRTAQLLLEVLNKQYPERGARVQAASEIVWLAADQQITPEDVDGVPHVDDKDLPEGQTCTCASCLFATLGVLGEKSRDVKDLAPDAEVAHTELGKRWRNIRSITLRMMLTS